ncbi:hypothetical protein, partial [Romboutsia ilealis]|uniref:hypothetical protein n=2 Tax=Romboutsia ilealis TaxID=1115758 RepID=UPI002572E0F5
SYIDRHSFSSVHYIGSILVIRDTYFIIKDIQIIKIVLKDRNVYNVLDYIKYLQGIYRMLGYN